MPVGTQATVKAQRPENLEEAGSQILLANTYHLLLRPGPEVFETLGGYHGFASWKRSVLTDSGGFQLFSLADSLSMSEEGATFRSHIDGRKIFLSPELSIATQISIGSDIMMALDQCIPSTADKEAARTALEITNRWARRSLQRREEAPKPTMQSLFAIVQGALFTDLRQESIDHLTSMDFDGFAIGGLAVGEEKNEREDICEFSAQRLPADRPRYLMGVGTPLDILEAVHRGVDMFDCIIPTQVAQHGMVFTSQGILKLPRGIYKLADEPLDPLCPCPTCSRFSRAYLHHLIKAKEPLSWQLLGQHNIYFYHALMREIRQSIIEDRFVELYRAKRETLHSPDLANPPGPHPQRKRSRLNLGAYEVHKNPAGFANIRHIDSGELMHSNNAPMDEARSLYVVQSRLVDRLTPKPGDQDPMVLWDVGLGAAANAMAAIESYESRIAEGAKLSDLHIISFENDMDSLRLAIRNNKDFPYLRHPGPAAILKAGRWSSKTVPGLRWTLLLGDFEETAPSEEAIAPHLIYFDMFSSKTNGDQWTLQSFQRVFEACLGRATELFTYSRSTAIRAALLASGFYVACGSRTGIKQETTIALTPAMLAEEHFDRTLLDTTWLQTWKRSTAKCPIGLSDTERQSFEAAILAHPQFH
jgi:queuine tRNA-ribosyltransferase